MGQGNRRQWALDWELLLPDFTLPSVLVRVWMASNALMLIGTLLQWPGHSTGGLSEWFLSNAIIGEPALILTLMMLAIVWPRVNSKTRTMLAMFGGAGWGMACKVVLDGHWNWESVWLTGVKGVLLAVVLCMYMDWRRRRLSPALLEAKLEALQARIQPHFLFNAINGIVMLLSSRPQAAEEALLNLADVFRALMKEGDAMVSLKQEIELAEKYLSIEKMRFAERLTISWHVEENAKDGLVPSLLIQPLIENAIIHGVEPRGSGMIDVRAFVKDKKLNIIVENEFKEGRGALRKGNGMALTNIQQRLELMYDADGALWRTKKNGVWRVWIQVPMVSARANKKKSPSQGR